jgi:hypothetical protein
MTTGPLAGGQPGSGSPAVAVSENAVFGRVMRGQCTPVSLPANQQSLLDGMDRALESRDPRLASMFAIFARLTRDEGLPSHERMASAPNWVVLRVQATVRWARRSATFPIVLVASLMLAIVVLGLTTASGRPCPRPATTHQVMPGKSTVCVPSANGLRK